MSQMVEGIAKALYEVRPEMEWGEVTPLADLGEPQKDPHRVLARAAVAALTRILDEELRASSEQSR
ncbi:MAG TPA: hypothetical protein VGU24_00240 [Microvirga sp.]|jgi:hypothetical protein|nr:hypothetical protein [Microvirga sp.]